MADGASSGNNSGLYFIVGALVVIVGLGAYFFLGGHAGSPFGRSTTTEQTTTTSPGLGSSTTTTTTKKE